MIEVQQAPEYLLETCLNEFVDLYNKDSYISKRVMDHFLDKYHHVFEVNQFASYSNKELLLKIKILGNNINAMIERHNRQFLNTKMENEKDYFDHMFESIDSSIKLDNEQRLAILTDEDYSLIVAGAGSGKTTTMAAKAKYLVDKCHINPSEIILISFTNKATEELDMRINQDFNLGIECLTFHKLGLKLLRETFDQPIRPVDGGAIYNIISRYVKEVIFPNKQRLKTFLETFKNELHFDLSCLEYSTYQEYYQDRKEKRYEEVKAHLREYNQERILGREKNKRTINGELLKSQGEVQIANFLFLNSIPYQYEKIYDYQERGSHTYTPDFTINGPDHSIYIEYYGMTSYRKDGTFSKDDIHQYQELIRKKQELHKKYKTDLIELYSIYEDGRSPLQVLQEELKKRNVICSSKSEEEIFERLMDTNQEWAYIDFIKLAKYFIEQFKNIPYQLEDFDRLKQKSQNPLLKRQLDFLRDIYQIYEQELHENNRIDFADMINYAYQNLDLLKQKKKFLSYQYIIIDEYQDISPNRYQLIKHLSDLFESKIVAVGDDWQSIFEFSGSKIDLFTNFREVLGYGEMIPIVNTYRNSQELIDVAGDFISKNTMQFQKRLKSIKHLNHPIELVSYLDGEYNHIVEITMDLIGKITFNDPKSKILLLGRYNSDIEPFILSGLFKYGEHDKIICNRYPKANVTFLTVHSAKGLGFDEVILLNARNSTYGFPSKIKDHEVIALLKEENKEKEMIEYPEERRLFYVALTRTKNKVYILTPDSSKKISSFIHEIRNEYQVIENKDYMINLEII